MHIYYGLVYFAKCSFAKLPIYFKQRCVIGLKSSQFQFQFLLKILKLFPFQFKFYFFFEKFNSNSNSESILFQFQLIYIAIETKWTVSQQPLSERREHGLPFLIPLFIFFTFRNLFFWGEACWPGRKTPGQHCWSSPLFRIIQEVKRTKTSSFSTLKCAFARFFMLSQTQTRTFSFCFFFFFVSL